MSIRGWAILKMKLNWLRKIIKWKLVQMEKIYSILIQEHEFYILNYINHF